MKLVITEKNIAADNISKILADTKPKTDKVYSTPAYRFTHRGEEWVCVGLKGHILELDFPERLVYDAKRGWEGITTEGELLPAHVPDSLPRPPFPSKRKPFLADGVDLKAWKVPALPYLVYSPLLKNPAEKEIIRALRNLAKKADSVIIATDFDREGELIGSDAMGVVLESNPALPIQRARYSAITKEEIGYAFSHLLDLDSNLAAAGESRQDIDLVWGAVLTRYLTSAKYSGFGNVRSAGRVQTPTLTLVVEREKLRDAFVPEDYWEVKASFTHGVDDIVALHAKGRFTDKAAADVVMAHVADASQGVVSAIDKKRRTSAPPAPFNTTSLMAAAAAEGITPARTMRIAESLYMNGFTSYPRVDNTVYPASLDLAATLGMLTDVPAYAPYARQLLDGGKLHPTRGKKEETDHPPIYPTGVGDPDRLKPEEWKLYNLIARRFMATLSNPAVIEGTKITIEVAGEPFVAKGDVLVERGYRAIYPYGLKKDEQLPVVNQHDEVAFNGAELLAKQTTPPGRYSQGSLLQEMERQGLGTKSTRHSIIERLYNVRYIAGDAIEPTQLGRAVIDALTEFAPHITSPNMTAELEAEMDSISKGTTTRDVVVGHSRDLLADVMEGLIPRKDELGSRISDAVTADARVGACPECGGDLLVKTSAKTRGSFLGCANWPDCSVTYPLPKGKIEPVEGMCPVCGKPQVKVIAFRTKPQVVCVDPLCPTNREPDIFVGECPVCKAAGREGRLVAQKSPRSLKRFIRCTNYELCDVSYPLPQRGKLRATGETCEHCGAPIVEVDNGSRRGVWRLCVNYDCPAKAEEQAAKEAAGKSRGASTPAGKRASATSKASAGRRTPSKGTAPKGTAKRTRGER